MRPRTTWPPSTSANGASTACGRAVGERAGLEAPRSARRGRRRRRCRRRPGPGARRDRAGPAGRTAPRPRRGTGCRTGPPATAAGHRPGQLAGERVRVVAQPGQRGGRQAGRQRRPSTSLRRSRRASASSRSSSASQSATRAASTMSRSRRGAAGSAAARRARGLEPAATPRRRARSPATAGTGRRRRRGWRRPSTGLSRQSLDRSPPLLELVAHDAPGRPTGRTASARAAPAERRDREPVRGAGEGDVAEPELLLGVVRPGRPRGRRRAPPCPAGELRQVARVAAQRGREDRRRGGPQRARPVGREAGLADADEEHRGPLQALGPVHGQQLDRVGGGGGGDVEAVALVVLGRRGRPAGRQGDVAVDGLELGDGLDEQVEVVAAGGGGRADGRGQLDVDAGGVDDPAHDVEQRLADVGAQHAQLGGQQGEALARRRRSRRRRPGRRARRRARDLGGVDAVGDRDEVVGRPPLAGRARARSRRRRARGRGRPSSRRSRGPIAQRGPVSRVSSAALAVGSWSRCRIATTSATSGRRSRPESPTISTGTWAAGERVEDVLGVRVVAGQHADVGPRPGLGVGGLDALDQPDQLVGLGLQRRRSSRARLGARAWPRAARPGRSGRRAARRAGWRPRGCARRNAG